MTRGCRGRLVHGAGALAAVVLLAIPAYGQGRGGRGGGSEQITSIDERTTGLKKMDGFFPLYWDEVAGRLWMEVAKLDTEILYSTGFGAASGRTTSGSIAARSRDHASSSSSASDRGC